MVIQMPMDGRWEGRAESGARRGATGTRRLTGASGVPLYCVTTLARRGVVTWGLMPDARGGDGRVAGVSGDVW